MRPKTSKFNGYSKLSCWNLFRSSNESILEAFQALGENLSPSTYDGLDKLCNGFILSETTINHFKYRRITMVDVL